MYYIHVRDEHFKIPPWPGERRLGPYSKEDAETQFAHDQSLGNLDVVGVFSEQESEARNNDLLEEWSNVSS